MKPNQFLLAVCCIFVVSLLAFEPASTLANAGPSRAGADVVPTKVPLKAFAFDLNQVALLDGPFKHAQDLDRRDLLATDMEVLYYPFRREAKLPTSVQGNDSLNYRWTGRVLGHYLSAAAFIIRNTGDQELKKKADAAVAE